MKEVIPYIEKSNSKRDMAVSATRKVKVMLSTVKITFLLHTL